MVHIQILKVLELVIKCSFDTDGVASTSQYLKTLKDEKIHSFRFPAEKSMSLLFIKRPSNRMTHLSHNQFKTIRTHRFSIEAEIHKRLSDGNSLF